MAVNDQRMKITVPEIVGMKRRSERIKALTAYDFLFASILDEAGMEIILVGDSGARVFAGHETTLPITLEEMIYHRRAVRRGVKRAAGGRYAISILSGFFRRSPAQCRPVREGRRRGGRQVGRRGACS